MVKDVKFEVLKKLLNYRYWDEYQKPELLQRIEKTRKKELTPELTYTNGWVLTEHIEEKDCPYKHPEKKRYQYLNTEFIEKDQYKYKGVKKWPIKKTVYRLKTSKFLELYVLFYEKGKIELFINSNYFKDVAAPFLAKFYALTHNLYEDLDENYAKSFESVILETHNKRSVFIENPELFYYYAKDKSDFKRILKELNNAFKEKNISPGHLKELITFSFSLSKVFNSSFNSDFKKLASKYNFILQYHGKLDLKHKEALDEK